MSKHIASAKLEIRVLYNLRGEKRETLEKLLHAAATHLAGEGLLTGETKAEVTSWFDTVEIVSTDTRSKSQKKGR